jgi:hypothetical protein
MLESAGYRTVSVETPSSRSRMAAAIRAICSRTKEVPQTQAINFKGNG